MEERFNGEGSFVHLKPAKHYIVYMEVDEHIHSVDDLEEPMPVDLPLTVPQGHLMHLLTTLAMNNVSFRVEPVEGDPHG